MDHLRHLAHGTAISTTVSSFADFLEPIWSGTTTRSPRLVSFAIVRLQQFRRNSCLAKARRPRVEVSVSAIPTGAPDKYSQCTRCPHGRFASASLHDATGVCAANRVRSLILNGGEMARPKRFELLTPRFRSLMLKKPTMGRRRIDTRNPTWLSHGHPGTRVDVITSCLRSKIETNFVPTVSFAMGIADTDVQLCPLSCASAHPGARPFIGHSLDTD
jgi:hypothetical protein